MKFYLLKIKKDPLRKVAPIGSWSFPKVTVHYRTARWDKESDSPVFTEGSVHPLEDEDVRDMAERLKVTLEPTKVLDRVEEVALAGPNGTAILQNLERHRSCPHGRGFVVQWFSQRNDNGTVQGWRSVVIDRSSKLYQPLDSMQQKKMKIFDPQGGLIAEEVPLAKYIEIRVVSPETELATVSLADEYEEAAGIEREEEAADPAGFERQKEQQRRTKAKTAVAPKSEG